MRRRQTGVPPVYSGYLSLSRVDVGFEPSRQALKAPTDELISHLVERDCAFVDADAHYRRVTDSGFETVELSVQVQTHAFRWEISRIQDQDSVLAIRCAHEQRFGVDAIPESCRGQLNSISKDMRNADFGMSITFQSRRNQDRTVIVFLAPN